MSEKGSFAAPLFFLALVMAAIASLYGTIAPSAVTAGMFAASAWAGSRGTFRMSVPAMLVLGYGIVVALHTLLVSDVYTPAGLYHPLILIAAFYAGQRLGEPLQRFVVLALLLFAAILAIWGLLQVGPWGAARARAVFETPATFAGVLNFPLVAVAALLASGKRSVPLAVLASLLAAAVYAAESRGAFIALAGGAAVVLVLGQRAGILKVKHLALAIALFATGCVLSMALRVVPWDQMSIGGVSETGPSAQQLSDSTQSRLELYSASWNEWLEHPFFGTGYLTFRYVLEQRRAAIPSYGAEAETWVVHNDYLQSLQELGPLGLVAFLALAVIPVLLAYRRIATNPEPRNAICVAAAGALGAMALHALVDFPFHVPVTLALFGVFLGVLDAQLAPMPHPTKTSMAALPPWARALRAIVAVLAGVLLLRPVVAEATAEWGMRRFLNGDSVSAAVWLSAAQRVEPADWRYHWYAGQFWDAQATAGRKPEAARLAAAAFEAGFRANPREVRNLLGMASVHRRYRDLLAEPATPGQLREWLAHAVELAPMSAAVRRERALTMNSK